ncbi:hypothetical protein [Actinomadura sp. WAC 06369]|uniref:hypothetical protein n=1 Tax=Actinomadura sp. WAC 06369 TaxID=2203193 RepID=UPI000F7A8481|nr:hypothetical protein [Actinomadura sp. WAC 06369]RSN71086.1 hypothetical protein DMH08_03750 [Actinomadura sp. WAC 06369]
MITLKAALVAASAVGTLSVGGGVTWAMAGAGSDTAVPAGANASAPAAAREAGGAPAAAPTCVPAPGVKLPGTEELRRQDAPKVPTVVLPTEATEAAKARASEAAKRATGAAGEAAGGAAGAAGGAAEGARARAGEAAGGTTGAAGEAVGGATGAAGEAAGGATGAAGEAAGGAAGAAGEAAGGAKARAGEAAEGAKARAGEAAGGAAGAAGAGQEVGELPVCPTAGGDVPVSAPAGAPDARVPAAPAVPEAPTPRLDCRDLDPAVPVGGPVEKALVLTKGLRHEATSRAARDLGGEKVCTVAQKWTGAAGRWLGVLVVEAPSGVTGQEVRRGLKLPSGGTPVAVPGAAAWQLPGGHGVLVHERDGRFVHVHGSPSLGQVKDVAAGLR